MLLLVFFLFLSNISLLVQAKERTFELNVTMDDWSPDCRSEQKVPLINNQYPGPPLYATTNDTVHVIVRNHGEEPTTIHFHGILQIGTTEADGLPGVTQAPIPPGGEFHQRFQLIDQAGTFFYHAHVGLQDDFIQGPLIVYPNDHAWPTADGDNDGEKTTRDGPYQYDDERIVQLSEWWAQDAAQRLDYYMGSTYDGLIAADYYLINGRAPSQAIHNKGVECKGYAAMEVTHDGNMIEPYDTDYLEVSSGQRYSVLVTMDQSPDHSYRMDVKPYWITNTTATGKAVLAYTKESSPQRLWPTRPQLASDHTKPIFPKEVSQWVFPELKPLDAPTTTKLDFEHPPDRTIVLMPKEHLDPLALTTRWLINGHAMPDWSMPLLEQLRQESFRHELNATTVRLNKVESGDGYDDNLQTYPIQHKEVVDVVVHTSTLLNHGVCAAHPWHTHGFVHYPIAHGSGKYNHAKDKNLRTYAHPVAKDTTLIYPDKDNFHNQAGVPCGWTKLRIYADNPGLWGFHCHITGHMLQGMMVVVEMGTDRIKYLQG
ncbi:multicopper oxidase-domain-containing protein [Absidia repens]|uniref:Multicopper oxidase-domain-containing protein n=1 Tax=Absidia repens TaxID=90262 RepID=A0A1X2INR1_9FUNG|nr:multicopper oxidase-domain-containing protein [Absidia repens]